MPIAQDMKKTTEDIEVSYGERMSWLEDAMKDTRQMIKGFGNDHRAMAKNLSSFLDGSESERISAFKKMLSGIQSSRRAREEEVSHALKKFDEEMRDVSSQLRQMAGQVKGFLSESESTRMASFEKMLSSIQSRQSRRSKKVAALIKKFDDELHEMASQLKEFLSDSEGTRLEEFKSMLSSIKSRQRAREEETARLISEYGNDIKEAHSHWKNLAKIMASKRTGKRVPITEVPKEAHVPKKVEKEAEQAFTEGEVMERARAIIFGRAGGISLKRLAKKLRVPHIRLARPISELVEEGRVVKRDSRYYPAEAESEEYTAG